MPLLRRTGAGQNINANKKPVGNFNAAGASNTGRIKLRRVPNKQQVINQNLQTLKENAAKKQLAQELYYQNKGVNVGRSPLKRQVGNRMPVKNRLGGANQQNFRQKVFQNRVPHMQNSNTLMQNRNNKFVRRYSVQERLANIKNSVNNINQVGQKIRLRRNQPVNYTVQVKNGTQKIKKKTSVLDPKLQAEIKAIQSRTPTLPTPETPLIQLPYGRTNITLNDRFTQLM